MASPSTTIELPYGNATVRIELPAGVDAQLYLPRDIPGVVDPVAEIRRAMAEPIGANRLFQLARGVRSVAIVVDDATRPVPTAELLRSIVDELAEAEIGHDRIRVVVATGLHRGLTDEEARYMLGGLPLTVVNHRPHDTGQLVDLGRTARGTPLRVNRTVAEAELKILTGDIELHQFVGYGGGAKSVLPGICDADGVRATHAKMEWRGAGPGRIDDNPIRLDIEEAADMLGVDFLVNVVLNSQHQVVHAVAGDVHAAFRAGIEPVDRMYKVEVPKPVDMVICSPGGYPKDIELYQSQKAIRSARRIVRQGGAIVALAECREGHGSEQAYAWASQAASPQDIIDRLGKEFVMGGHKAYQLAADVQWADVYLHSSLDPAVAEAFFLRPLADLKDVAGLAAKVRSVAVLPQASLTLPMLAGQEKVDF